MLRKVIRATLGCARLHVIGLARMVGNTLRGGEEKCSVAIRYIVSIWKPFAPSLSRKPLIMDACSAHTLIWDIVGAIGTVTAIGVAGLLFASPLIAMFLDR